MTRTNNKSCSSLMLHQIKTCSDFIGCNPEESRMIHCKDKQFHQELDINRYIFESSVCGKNTSYYCPVAATESLHHMVLFISELRPSQNVVKYLKRRSLRGWNVSAQLEELSRSCSAGPAAAPEEARAALETRRSENTSGVLLLERQEKCGYFWLSKTELPSVTVKIL